MPNNHDEQSNPTPDAAWEKASAEGNETARQAATEGRRKLAAKAMAELLGAATGGASKVFGAVTEAALGPSPDELVERAQCAADRDAALQVPSLRREQALARTEVAHVRAVLKRHLDEHREKCFEGVEEELLRLTADGVISIGELEGDPRLLEGVLFAYRKSLDTVCVSAIPLLARLAVAYRDRPVDRDFRMIGRAVTDMSEGEVRALPAFVSACDAVLEACGLNRDVSVMSFRVPHLMGHHSVRGRVPPEGETVAVRYAEALVNAEPTAVGGLMQVFIACGVAIERTGMGDAWPGLEYAVEVGTLRPRLIRLLGAVGRADGAGTVGQEGGEGARSS